MNMDNDVKMPELRVLCHFTAAVKSFYALNHMNTGPLQVLHCLTYLLITLFLYLIYQSICLFYVIHSSKSKCIQFHY